MHVIAFIIGFTLCLGVALDAFQTIILPRRPKSRFRLTRFFYLLTWRPWVALAESFQQKRVRDQLYSFFGPLSLLLLLVLWAVMLIGGFGFMYFSFGTPFADNLNSTPTLFSNLRACLYVSGTSLFTLGLGDVVPKTHLARAFLVFESGTGLGFVALVIGFVPILYQAFSRRETSVALLDGRAGSPPTSAELLRRHGYDGGHTALIDLLIEWERWSAELLESHVSYPILCYYRSQHDNQSWLAALVAILDTCALLITTIEGEPVRQAQLTFAMARHALIDLGHIFHLAHPESEDKPGPDRLPQKEFFRLCEALGEMHMRLCGDPAAMQRLTEIRSLYEPHAYTLCTYLRLALPLWLAEPQKTDAWRAVADLTVSNESALRATEHISASAVTAHLHDEDHG